MMLQVKSHGWALSIPVLNHYMNVWAYCNFKEDQFAHVIKVLTKGYLLIRRQCGQVVRPLGLKSGGHGLKSHSGH